MFEGSCWFVTKYKGELDYVVYEDVIGHKGFIEINWDARVVTLYDEKEGDVWMIPFERVLGIRRGMYPNEKLSLAMKKDEKKKKTEVK